MSVAVTWCFIGWLYLVQDKSPHLLVANHYLRMMSCRGRDKRSHRTESVAT